MNSMFLKIYAALAIGSFTLFALGALLAWLRVLSPMAGFGMFALGCLIGVIVTVIGVIAILLGKSGWVVAFWFLGAVPAGVLALAMVQGRGYPLINDVTTDTANPPQYIHAAQMPENQGWDMAFPSDNGPLIAEHYPQIQPLTLERPLDEVAGRAQQIAAGQPDWVILDITADDGHRRIEGYSETALFRFRDYFVIDIRETEHGTVLVNMRSKSKDGRGDFGVNANRIHEFLEQLNA